jgi:hypothetical protein
MNRFIWSDDEVKHYKLRKGCTFESRIEAQREGGWKVRPITLSDLAPLLIGAVGRQFCDQILLDDDLNKVGLKQPAKLWRLLNVFDRKKGQFVIRESTLRNYCLSVDLTTATDAVPRYSVRQVLNGFRRAAKFTDDMFMNLVFDIALSSRTFTCPNYPELAPQRHRAGILMGELLSGIFLNTMTYTVRCFLPLWHTFCVCGHGIPVLGFLNATSTNEECIRFLRTHRKRIQEFLDHPMEIPKPPNNSLGAGDDMILFSDNNVGLTARLLYLVFEMQPSEKTWYCSRYYGTFTEETCLRSEDPDGKFIYVDEVKPRLFTNYDDSNGSTLVGHLKSISTVARYVLHDIKDEEHYFKICTMCDRIVNKDARLLDTIRRHDVPVGLSTAFGGIHHPIGLYPGYVSRLSEQNQRLVFTLMNMDEADLMVLTYENQDVDETNISTLRQRIREFLQHIYGETQIFSLPEVKNLVEDTEQARALRGYTGKTWQIAQLARKTQNLINLSVAVTRLEAGLNFRAQLTGSALPYQVKSAYTRIKNKIRKLRSYEPYQGPQLARLPDSYQLHVNILEKGSSYFFNEEVLDNYMKAQLLPSSKIQWAKKEPPVKVLTVVQDQAVDTVPRAPLGEVAVQLPMILLMI